MTADQMLTNFVCKGQLPFFFITYLRFTERLIGENPSSFFPLKFVFYSSIKKNENFLLFLVGCLSWLNSLAPSTKAFRFGEAFSPFRSYLHRPFFYTFSFFFANTKYGNLQLVGVKYPFPETIECYFEESLLFAPPPPLVMSFTFSGFLFFFFHGPFFLPLFPSHFLSSSALLQRQFNVIQPFFKSISSYLHFSAA